MPFIKIDNKAYDLDILSDEAKAQLQSLQFVEAELQRLQARTAVLQAARMAYSKACKLSCRHSPATPSSSIEFP